MDETLNCSMVLFDAAGLAAALTAAPVYSSKQAGVTFVMPALKTRQKQLLPLRTCHELPAQQPCRESFRCARTRHGMRNTRICTLTLRNLGSGAASRM